MNRRGPRTRTSSASSTRFLIAAPPFPFNVYYCSPFEHPTLIRVNTRFGFCATQILMHLDTFILISISISGKGMQPLVRALRARAR